jgi:hypothetical protein
MGYIRHLLMKRFLLLLPAILFASSLLAQKITGTVTDDKGAPLAFASITVKGTNKGAVANSTGKFSIPLEAGTYQVVCQYVGYTRQQKEVVVEGASTEVNFALKLQELNLQEVVIKQGEDPALRIIREAIKKRDFYNDQVDSFTVDVYIKGQLRTRSIPDKVLGRKVDRKELMEDGFDSSGKGILFLSESVTKVAYKRPNKIRYDVVSSRQSGGGFGLNFPFFINFYTNNVNIFRNSINPRGLISPIADGALHYYKFRYEGNFFEGDKMIDRIRVTPKRRFEPCFEGYIQIVDGEWRIHSLDLKVMKENQLELLDTLRITQIQTPVAANIWRTQNQVLYLSAKFLGVDFTGNFLNVYTNYNLDPSFQPKTFGRTIMKYDTAFNKKDSSYWASVRPLALEADEKKDFQFKDSVSRYYRDSMYSQRNIDSLRKKQRQKPIELKDLLFGMGGINRTIYSRKAFIDYHVDALVPMHVNFNTVEGLNLTLNQTLNISPRKGNLRYLLESNSRYGFSNRHFNSFAALTIKPKRGDYRNQYLTLSGGTRVQQINRDNPIKPLINTLFTLFSKENYMKIYENTFGRVEYNNRLENGLRWNVSANWEQRRPLENTTNYSWGKKGRTYLPNHPYELAGIPFERHTALVAELTLSYQPGQRYIEFPNNKVPIGSNMPVFELRYAKGLPDVLNSVADFDKWRFSVYDDLNLKIGGLFRYRLSVGGFLNNKRVDLPDFTHFIGNQIFDASPYLNSFQLAPYYRYSNTEPLYGVAHLEHHFNGLLTNKIPLFNRLKWHLVGAGNAFYVNRNNYYVEASLGLENILKIFRVDFVTAYQTQPGNSFGIRVGMGGIFGGMIERSLNR